MPKFKVSVIRISSTYLDIEVEASDEDNARSIALDDIGNHVFPSEKNAEYDVDYVEEVKE